MGGTSSAGYVPSAYHVLRVTIHVRGVPECASARVHRVEELAVKVSVEVNVCIITRYVRQGVHLACPRGRTRSPDPSSRILSPAPRRRRLYELGGLVS